MEKSFYTPEELCDLLPVGRSRIYQMLKTGEIPRKRIGKKYIVPRKSFDEWIASCDKPKSVWEDPNLQPFWREPATASAR